MLEAIGIGAIMTLFWLFIGSVVLFVVGAVVIEITDQGEKPWNLVLVPTLLALFYIVGRHYT